MRGKTHWIVLFLFSHFLSNGQFYSVKTYSAEEGLCLDQITTITTDPNGFLWLGSEIDGLCRFDGKSFERFNSIDVGVTSFVADIKPNDVGDIWIAGNNVLQRFKNGITESFSDDKKYPPLITCLEGSPDSVLWFGTDKGLYQLNIDLNRIIHSGESHSLSRAKVNAIKRINGNIWVGTEKGLYVSGSDNKFFDQYEGLAGANVIDLLLINDKIWVLTQSQGIFEIDGDKVISNYFFEELKESKCMTLWINRELWIGTEKGRIIVLDIQSGDKDIIDEDDGLSGGSILAMNLDSFNNIWISTSDNKLLRIKEGNYTFFNEKQGLPGGGIRDFFIHQNDFFILSEEYGPVYYSGHGFKTILHDSISNPYTFNCLSMDGAGNIWMGIEADGIIKYNGENIFPYSKSNGSISNRVTDIVLDSLGFLWVSTFDQGIFQIEKGDSVLTPGYIIGVREGLPTNSVDKMVVDNENRIWFTSNTGEIGCIQDGRVVGVYQLTGSRRAYSINDIVLDEMGHLIVATAGYGLFMADIYQDEPDFRSLPLMKPLKSSNVHFLAIDKESLLWVGTSRGIEKLEIDEKGLVKAQYSLSEILDFSRFSAQSSTAAADQAGNIWLSGEQGVYRFGKEQVPSFHPPIIHVEKMELLYEPIEFEYYINKNDLDNSNELILSSGNNDIGFYYRAIDLNFPDDVEFRWRIEGEGSEWSSYSDNTSIQFANLDPGNYLFQVQARSFIGNESKIASVPFKIEGPIWSRGWFKFLGVLLLTLGTYAIWRTRLKFIRREESRKRAELEMKNELLELEQKAMQLQMNPHFIFNSLNSIQSLIVNGKGNEARKQINAFATLMRSLLNNSRVEFVDLEEEIKLLTSYIKFEQFCKPGLFDYRIAVDQNIDLESIEIPSMLIQPFVENSINHGFSTLKGRKGNLLINLEKKGRNIECTIKDNGVGRAQAAVVNKSLKTHKSTAIEITKKRLEAISKNKYETVFNINDVTDENGAVSGTEVILLIKYRSKF